MLRVARRRWKVSMLAGFALGALKMAALLWMKEAGRHGW